jgi:hypothetical protein
MNPNAQANIALIMLRMNYEWDSNEFHVQLNSLVVIYIRIQGWTTSVT